MMDRDELVKLGADVAHEWLSDSHNADMVRMMARAVLDAVLPAIENQWEQVGLALGEWHRQRFPDAQIEHVALKICEEAGEVASAVNGLVGRNSATGGGDVLAELADVVIAAIVLADRWCAPSSLLDAVKAKLCILTDPTSEHPAARRRAVEDRP